jgi:hypothetical protein
MFEVMRSIEEKGAEAESRIHEKLRYNSDICMMKEKFGVFGAMLFEIHRIMQKEKSSVEFSRKKC